MKNEGGEATKEFLKTAQRVLVNRNQGFTNSE